MGLKVVVFKEKDFQGRLKELTEVEMTDRNMELVPDNWSLVKERALTIENCSEGWHSGHSGVCTDFRFLVRGKSSD